MAQTMFPLEDGHGGWIWYSDKSPVVAQLIKAGVVHYILKPIVVHPSYVTGIARLGLLNYLNCHADFVKGDLHHLHEDVGTHRRDYRSTKGVFGPGSLQIVMDERTGNLYADVDRWNPYEDVMNWAGHAFGEVLPHWMRRRA